MAYKQDRKRGTLGAQQQRDSVDEPTTQGRVVSEEEGKSIVDALFRGEPREVDEYAMRNLDNVDEKELRETDAGSLRGRAMDNVASRSFDPRRNADFGPDNRDVKKNDKPCRRDTRESHARFDDEGGAQYPPRLPQNKARPSVRAERETSDAAPRQEPKRSLVSKADDGLADNTLIYDTLPSGTRIVHDET